MRIEHVAIWVKDLEAMKTFYETYFNGNANAKYHNKEKEFESYFLTFDGGARLEIMRKSGIDKPQQEDRKDWLGSYFHFPRKQRVCKPNDISPTK